MQSFLLTGTRERVLGSDLTWEYSWKNKYYHNN